MGVRATRADQGRSGQAGREVGGERWEVRGWLGVVGGVCDGKRGRVPGGCGGRRTGTRRGRSRRAGAAMHHALVCSKRSSGGSSCSSRRAGGQAADRRGEAGCLSVDEILL